MTFSTGLKNILTRYSWNLFLWLRHWTENNCQRKSYL